MKVLMITGDKNLLIPGTEANGRLALQRAQVEELAVMYWGRGSRFPSIPKGSFDVITAQDPFFRGHLAGHLAKLTGAKLNLQVHTDLSALSWLMRRWAIFNIRKADSVRVVSEKIKKQLEAYGIDAPIHVLPIYIDIAKYRSVTRRPHSSKNILWVGRFEKEKNPLQAIGVLGNVLKSVPDAKLTMLGSGNLKDAISARTINLPVTMPGWQDPVPYLEVADVVLCTSLHESWGASMIEALAAGVPVVAPDVGVAREVGAIVVPREELGRAVTDVLMGGKPGVLKVTFPSATDWAAAWLHTL